MQNHLCGILGRCVCTPEPPQTLPDPDDLRAILAYNLRSRRVELGLSQEKLALDCGLDRTYVSAVERCVWNISLGNIERFAQRLGVAPWVLLKPPA